MSNLGPNAINTTYPGLLQVDGGVSDILKPVTDGLGNPTGLSLSSTGVSISGVVSANAQNIVGGTAGAVLYQAGVGSTGFVVPGSAGQFLQSNGVNAPTWATFNAGSIGALPLSGGTLTGPLSLSNNTISSVGNPVNAYDAANKSYVDSKASGLNVKSSCVVATTVNITLSGTQTIDGVAVTAGQRVLVKNQSTQSQNGIYVVAASSWSRSSDASTWADLIGATVFITSGSTQAASTWTCNATAGGTIGVTAVIFVQFSASQSYTASNGITLTGNNFTLTSPVPQSLGGTGSTNVGTGIVYSDGTSLIQASGAQIASSIGTATVLNSTNSTNSTYANNLTGGAVGDLLYQSASGVTSKLNISSPGYILTSNGTGPEWGLVAPYATRLQNGAAGSIPYQTGSSQTSFVAGGSNGQVLTYDATTNAPYWSNTTGGRVGTYIAAGTNKGFANGGSNDGVLIGGGTTSQTNGMWLSCDGNANWLTAKISKDSNPSEFIVYNSASCGYATVANSTQITNAAGTAFSTSWIGKIIAFGNHKYTVSGVSGSTLTVGAPISGTGRTTPSTILEPVGSTYPFFFCYTSGTGQATISGNTLTWISGDPFVFSGVWFAATPNYFYVNGVEYLVASTPTYTTLTLTTTPPLSGTVTFSYFCNINNQLSTYRCHGVDTAGLEEHVSIYSIAGDYSQGNYFAMRTAGAGVVPGVSGAFTNKPLLLGAELYSAHSAGNDTQWFNDDIGIYPNNYAGSGLDPHVCLGGTHWFNQTSNTLNSRDLFRVYGNNSNTAEPNRFVINATYSGGDTASLAVDGPNADLYIDLRAKGAGGIRLGRDKTSYITAYGSTGNTPGFVAEGAGTNLDVVIAPKGTGGLNLYTATETKTIIKATGTAANIDIVMTPKGTGCVVLNNKISVGDQLIDGYVFVKDYAGNLVKLATIA